MTKTKKPARPMPTDPADLARAMFAVADKKIDPRSPGLARKKREERPKSE